ncbi:ankyrin repeat domain-containing protein 27-like isoform X2 [Babylonia areolata]|uniref:ankyrin repeat domain-containing protein 27-like isoform X2 n=1 Tax=Babylonia areolata TaxID=304850 RepID=UPI003FD32EBF
MASYDEDLYENPFFLTIHKQFTALFNKAVAEKALVCIPKYASCSHHRITEADVKDHVLFLDTAGGGEEEEEEDKSNVYMTLSQKVVLIKDGKLYTRDGFEHQLSVPLLFEETFHSENDNSYRVLCVEHFLNHLPVAGRKDSHTHRPASYGQCLDLLWNHSGEFNLELHCGQKTRDHLDKMLIAFGEVYDTLEGENLRSIVDMASAHFTKAMQLLLKDSVVRRSAKHNSAYMDGLKVAVETYMMNSVHTRLFRVVTALMANEDSEINKMTRNLSSLQLQDIGIRKIFSQNLPPAKKELAGLNRFSSPMGRLFCIKRVVTALTRPLKQSGKSDDSTAMMTTDDFLPILIFLIIKSEIPNWMANLVYMRHFHLAKSSDDDEFGFYLASVEAALEHIKSGYISEDIKINKPKREGWAFLDLSPGQSDAASDGADLSRQDSSSSVTDEFFRSVQEGKEEAVLQMLRRPQRSSEKVHLELCHPLCSCDRCDKVLSTARHDYSLVTAFTRDNRGYTALHMAAYYGQGKLIDLLIQSGAVVDATDYLGLTPLHLACQRGYQDVMLLLLHFGADVMSKDNEGNTPLHHCCVNGHEDCVKALVFYDGVERKLQVNAMNEMRDTALHLAAKWGYEVIVKTLVENGANATIKNRKQQSPVHLAQNIKVQRILQSSTEGLELRPLSFASITVEEGGGKGGKATRTPSSSSSTSDPARRGSLSVGGSGGDMEDCASWSRVETASLDEVQDLQLKKRREKLFRAIMAGDTQLVKFYLGIKESGAGQGSDEEDSVSSTGSLGDMCHPLCQCHKCLAIQKAQVKAHQALSVNVKTTSGYTPLHMAVLHGHDDMVQLFLDHGAHVNTQNHKNLTPLHISACMRKLLTMRLLVEKGARLNMRDINGDTPLLICSASGFCEGVRLLVERGADVNLFNHSGNTALHEATDHSHTSIVLTLLQAGANPTLRNKQTRTPANLAKDPQIEQEVQRATREWRSHKLKAAAEEHTSSANHTQPVVGNTQIRTRDLFAAFEDDDLKTLQTLTTAIRRFNKEGSLRKTVTRDNSHTFLDSMSHRHSICSFDSSSLKRITTEDRSGPMYIYSLETEGGDEEQEEEEGGKDMGERGPWGKEGVCGMRKSQSEILGHLEVEAYTDRLHGLEHFEVPALEQGVCGRLEASASEQLPQCEEMNPQPKAPERSEAQTSRPESQVPELSKAKIEAAASEAVGPESRTDGD